MEIFKALTTLLNPKKAEFTKRLIAKRRSCASNPLLAGGVTMGTTEYKLRSIGLKSAEYAVSPEATIVNILEQYWVPHIANFYINSSSYGGLYVSKPWDTPEQKAALAKKQVNDLASHIEYRLTGNSLASETLPEFDNFIDYMRYRVLSEHSNNSSLRANDGYTDSFYEYALEESKHVFNR
jgi:hypothetical protein